MADSSGKVSFADLVSGGIYKSAYALGLHISLIAATVNFGAYAFSTGSSESRAPRLETRKVHS